MTLPMSSRSARHQIPGAALGAEPAFAGGSDDEFLVHGHELSQRGDPRGELVHIQHALSTKPKDRKLRAAQAKLFKDHPDLSPPVKSKTVNLYFRQKLTWRLGYLDTARIQNMKPESFVALIDHPSARFLRRLEVLVGSRLAPTIVLQLARTPRPALRELVMIETDVDLGVPANVPTYDTEAKHEHRKGDALWRAVPGLTLLEIRAFRLFHSLALPALRELVAIGYPFCTTPWVAPKLEKLTWRVGRKEHLETCVRTGDVDVLDVALTSKLPALHTIDLADCEIENEYSETTREAFDVTLRRANCDLTVVLP